MTVHPTYLTLGALVVALLLAAVVARLANAAVHRAVDPIETDEAQGRAALQGRARRLIRAMTIFAYGVAVAASLSFGVSRFDAGEPRWAPRVLLRWFLDHGVNILIIIAGAVVVIHAANLAIVRLQYRLARGHATGDLEWQRRTATLSGILTSIVSVTVAFMALLTLLRELSIDVMPILTGAGIAGLAIGFGAQNLVRDIISGFFLIVEDQVRVGDVARINGVSGTVEQVNLRTIVLRDGEGAVQVFPNGTVTSLANVSKQFAYAIAEVRVAYQENIDRVLGTIREVGESMEADARWGPYVLEPIDVLGVESLADGLATIRVRFKTAPLNQSRVANELRRRLMTAFVGRGIRPFAK